MGQYIIVNMRLTAVNHGCTGMPECVLKGVFMRALHIPPCLSLYIWVNKIKNKNNVKQSIAK